MPVPRPDLPLESDVQLKLAEHAERSLYRFTKLAWQYVDPEPFVDGRHLQIMSEYTEAFLDGLIPRLLINVPPGHMKSFQCSVLANAWCWGPKNRPGRRFMATSYRGDLALRDADRCRELMRSEWYQRRWGGVFAMRRDQDMKTRYQNDHGGYRFSSAISGIMGEGGDYVVLDDPHNVKQAESDEVRDETVRTIRMALPTRVRSRDGGVLVVMQRLHERDYAGRMIADEADLVHLCLPARYEKDHPYVTVPITVERTLSDGTTKSRVLPGDFRTEDGQLLWPELFNEKRLAAITVELSAYGLAGQLQQRPAPREGGMFQRGDFHIIDRLPDGMPLARARGWDLGATEGGGTYTVGAKMSLWRPHIIVVEHVVRDRKNPHGVDAMIKTATAQDGFGVVQDLPQDPGQAGKSQKTHLGAMVAGYTARFSPESGAKETRAHALSSQAEAGNLFLLKGEWNDAYIDEMCAFPNGHYTDQADASSRAYSRLVQMTVFDSGATGASPEVIGGDDVDEAEQYG